jgi:hypothetical protein
MAIYKNLNSKYQDNLYTKLTENLVELLADRIMRSILSQPSDDEAFAKLLVAIYTKMSRLEVQKIIPPKLSTCFHDLSVYLASVYPSSRCNSSESAHTRSDNSQPSPIPFDSNYPMPKLYGQYRSELDQIEEEDLISENKQDNKIRFHSQPRKAREISPTKNAFKQSLVKNYNKLGEDIMGKYLKMSEKFSEKKSKKEESLYFSNGIFFHIP